MVGGQGQHGAHRSYQLRQSVSRPLQLGKVSLLDEGALLHDQDSVETGGEAGYGVG